MSWKDTGSTWLSNKTRQEDPPILELIRCLVKTNIIPETLVDNSMLQTILLTQIMLETLNGLAVPKAPQGTYHMNAKEVMMWILVQKMRNKSKRWKNRRE